jgi:predicted house-cleaning noncanonical NTP pyrophosphatase (MazG superfamily)
MDTETKLSKLDDIIFREMSNAQSKYGNYHNSHEFYAVLLEEVEEYWESVKQNRDDHYELIQVIAVALRYLMERADVESIQKKQCTRWDT